MKEVAVEHAQEICPWCVSLSVLLFRRQSCLVLIGEGRSSSQAPQAKISLQQRLVLSQHASRAVKLCPEVCVGAMLHAVVTPALSGTAH